MPRKKKAEPDKAHAGSGHLYQQPSGTWAISGRYRGVRYHVSGDDPDQAREARERRKAEIYGGQQGREARKRTLAGALEAWLETKAPPATKHGTYGRYALAVKHLTEDATLGSIRLSDLGASWGRVRTAYRRLVERGLSASSLHQCHIALSGAVAVAAEDGVQVPQVPKTVRPPKVEHAPARAPDPADVQLLIAHSVHQWVKLWTLAANTGMRLGELLALDWRDLRPEGVTVRRAVEDGPAGSQRVRDFPKTGKRGIRTVPLPPDVVAVFAERGTGLVFANREGELLLKSNAIRAFKDAAERAKLTRSDWHPHLLRHGYASHLLARGVPITEVAYLMGHASPQITLAIYGHFIPRDTSRAAAVIAEVYGATLPAVMSGSKQVSRNGISGSVTSGVTSAAGDGAA